MRLPRKLGTALLIALEIALIVAVFTCRLYVGSLRGVFRGGHHPCIERSDNGCLRRGSAPTGQTPPT